MYIHHVLCTHETPHKDTTASVVPTENKPDIGLVDSPKAQIPLQLQDQIPSQSSRSAYNRHSHVLPGAMWGGGGGGAEKRDKGGGE